MPEKIAQIFTFTMKKCAVFSYANHRNLHSYRYSELSGAENQQRTVHGLKSQLKLRISPNEKDIHAQETNVYPTIAHLEHKGSIKCAVFTEKEGAAKMVYKEQLQNIYSDLQKQKNLLERQQRDLPDGYLNIRTYEEKCYYTWQIPKGGRRKKTFRKGITKDKEQINKLVRKRYLNGAISRIDKDLQLLEGILAQYKEIDEDSVMKEYIQKHPDLKEGLHYGNMSNEEWMEDYRKPEGLYEDGLKSTSSLGDRMRSKGELIIASRLEFFGIPYRYEARIPHPDVNRVPDFTIRRPRDGKIFYWEHLGRTTDMRYLEENIRKLREYADIGITPWDNLIITYDQDDGGIDVKKIDAIIKGWLL